MKKNLFTQVQVKKPPRSVFDLSHQFAATANYGWLYPCLVLDLVPGDKINLSCDALVRAAPLAAPTMNRNDVYIHYWAVPQRILWPGWEDYITQQPYDDTASIPAHPFVTIEGDVFDDAQSVFMSYFGLPTGMGQTGTPDITISPFAFAAYQMIYNEWYRDQNLIDPVSFELEDGDNTPQLLDLVTKRKRAWSHDYLTSALPFAQKGNAVSIPLGNVVLKQPWDVGIPHPRFVAADGDPDNGALAQAADLLDPTTSNITIAGNPKYAYNPDGTLTVAPTTINDLRRAYRLQEWYEKQARGGTRYIEVILSHFGIRSSDARLQRPEYITGAKSPLVISEVLQTSASDDTTSPQGNMAGHGVAGIHGNYGKYYAEEHTIIIGIMSILPRAQYGYGIHKRFLKYSDPFEYYWPEFANIGEQAIQNQEVNWFTSNGLTNTFGYIPRYAEYKFQNNIVAGEFANQTTPWVQTRQFPNNVALNQAFIECSPDYAAFAVTDETVDHFYINMWHSIRAVRPMPYYGTPTI